MIVGYGRFGTAKITEEGDQGYEPYTPPPMVDYEPPGVNPGGPNVKKSDWSWVKDVFDIFAPKPDAHPYVDSGVPAGYVPTPTPSWVMPAAIGGGVLALLGVALVATRR